MKKVIYPILVVLLTVLNSCSDEQEFKEVYYNGVEPNFGDSDAELGSLFAESLHKTAEKLKEDEIDLKNHSAVQKVSSEATLEVMSKKYSISKEELLAVQDENVSFKRSNKIHQMQTLKSAAVSDDFSLTTMQQRTINVIEHARVNSKSAYAFMDKLAAINRRVDDLVPEGERELLHQMIAVNYYAIKKMNKLVKEGYLPGNYEARPKKIKTGTTITFSDITLSGLAKVAHANNEVTVLPEVVVVAPKSSGGNGISPSDWYLLQDAYGNRYQDEDDNDYRDGNGNGSQDGNGGGNYDWDGSSNSGESSWWDCMRMNAGKNIGRGIAGGFLYGFVTGGIAGAAGGTAVVPIVGTVVGGVGVAVVGGTVGAVRGAVMAAFWSAQDC